MNRDTSPTNYSKVSSFLHPCPVYLTPKEWPYSYIDLAWYTSIFNIQKDRDISTSLLTSAAVRTRNLSVDESFCEMQQMLFGIKAPDDREKNELC